jgi:mannose-6-phosphate isomerase-like protein (cupin superfamily)
MQPSDRRRVAGIARIMTKHLTLAGLLVSFASGWLLAQAKPTPPVVAISSADIDAVLKYAGSEGAGTDRQIRVVDLGGYRLGVGVLKRGPTRAGAPVGAISHSQVTEVFYIISGGATLVTGGTVENDRPFPPETEFVRLAVGPSSGGTFQGGDRRKVAPGDVVVVPAGVPHGFDDISDQVTYLSVRPDLTGALPANYLHPALRK